jgi:hypothetical protein
MVEMRRVGKFMGYVWLGGGLGQEDWPSRAIGGDTELSSGQYKKNPVPPERKAGSG